MKKIITNDILILKVTLKTTKVSIHIWSFFVIIQLSSFRQWYAGLGNDPTDENQAAAGAGGVKVGSIRGPPEGPSEAGRQGA